MKKVLRKTFVIPSSLKMGSVKEEKGQTIVYCEAKRQKVECKFCGGNTRDYDHRTCRKKHTVVSGKAVILDITRRRVQCKACKKVFVEPLEGLSRSGFSDHFTQQVQEKARGQDCSTVSREMGICCASVCKKLWELEIPKIKKPKKNE